MREKLITVYQKLILENAVLVIAVLAVFAAFVIYQVKDFEVDASPDRLILETDDDWKYYRRLSDRFPSGPVSSTFLVIDLPEGVFTEAGLAKVAELTADLRQLEGVTQIRSVRDLPILGDPELTIANFSEKARSIAEGASDLALAEKEFYENPFYEKLFLSADGKATNIFITYQGNDRLSLLTEQRQQLRKRRDEGTLTEQALAELQSVEAEVKALQLASQDQNVQRVVELRALLEKYQQNHNIVLSGLPLVSADIISSIKQDLGFFGGGILLFLALTLTIIFRKFQWVILPLLCCVSACVVMFGYLGWARFPVTLVSANFPAILIIITMSMIIHLVVVYREAAKNHPDFDEHALVAHTTRTMFLPCLYTVLTTCVAFFSLIFSGIRPVIDFGLMMTAGLVVAFIIAFLLFPSVLMLFKRPIVDKESPDHKEHRPVTLYFASFTEKFGNPLVVMCIGLAVLAVFGIKRLSVENRFIDYFKESTEISKGLLKLDQEFMGTLPLEIVLKGNVDPVQAWKDAQSSDGPAESVSEEDCFIDDECVEDVFGQSAVLTISGVERIARVQRYLDSLPETGKVLSVLTGIQVAERVKGSPLETLELAIMSKILPADLKELMYDTFLNEITQEVRFIAFLRDTDPNLQRDEFLKQIKHGLQTEAGLSADEFRITGLMVLYNNMLQSLFDSQIKTLGFVFFCIMIMFVLLFRSVSISLIAMVPNLLSAGIILGVMGWLDIALNLMTVTIAAITVGIAVDDTIHYIYRFREEFKKDRNYMATMYRSHSSIGKAMYYTSLTVILGFSILVVSDFKPYVLFGVFTSLAMAIALMGALTLLPKLILIVKPFGPEADRV